MVSFVIILKQNETEHLTGLYDSAGGRGSRKRWRIK